MIERNMPSQCATVLLKSVIELNSMAEQNEWHPAQSTTDKITIKAQRQHQSFSTSSDGTNAYL